MVAMMVVVTRMAGMIPLISSFPILTSASRPKNHQRHAGRQQHRQRSGNRNHARRHLRLTALADHRRQTGRRECRGRRGTGTANGAKSGAGQRSCHAEAARNPADPRRRRFKQIVGDTRQQHKIRHQQKHRDGDQLIRRHRRKRRGLQDAEQH
jgi:hypothetical protein